MEAVDALDTLDGVLLATIVETENSTGDMLEANVELEERLTRFWSRTYAKYAEVEEARLCQLFVKRGVALTTTIIPNADLRKRLYRTSLAPRAGAELLHAYQGIRDSLAKGTGYARMEEELRFAYILEIVSQVAAMPKFAIAPYRKTTPYVDVLRWWLLQISSDDKPSASSVSDWFGYISNNFVYRFNWGLGSVLCLSINESNEGNLQETSIADWPRTGLPWIAFWLKELITWGTLEPVAAYLLSRGMAVTRSEAQEKSLRYYAELVDEEDSEALLDPRRIRDWTTERYEPVGTRQARPGLQDIAVALTRDFKSTPNNNWRVIPAVSQNRVQWYDPGGFLLATSTMPEAWDEKAAESVDFILDSEISAIRSTPYV